MIFNATSNNISVISWRSVLLVEKTTNLLRELNYRDGRRQVNNNYLPKLNDVYNGMILSPFNRGQMYKKERTN
jgi:hypothetical protein